MSTLIIAGSRHLYRPDMVDANVKAWMHKFGETLPTLVLSGAAPGIDKAGEAWAAEHGIPVLRFEADWDRHRKAAGPIRNAHMVNHAAAFGPGASGLVCIHTGGRGSLDVLQKARAAGLRVHEWRADHE